ncbi:hypothetical protein HanIR_Chr13g0644371 [Helianthus annuus]|nr:hypothetical protein HanIR_Chr13g0644371 [Helianthus annuus]
MSRIKQNFNYKKGVTCRFTKSICFLCIQPPNSFPFIVIFFITNHILSHHYFQLFFEK